MSADNTAEPSPVPIPPQSQAYFAVLTQPLRPPSDGSSVPALIRS
jgi:hypothetical protein